MFPNRSKRGPRYNSQEETNIWRHYARAPEREGESTISQQIPRARAQKNARKNRTVARPFLGISRIGRDARIRTRTFRLGTLGPAASRYGEDIKWGTGAQPTDIFNSPRSLGRRYEIPNSTNSKQFRQNDTKHYIPAERQRPRKRALAQRIGALHDPPA